MGTRLTDALAKVVDVKIKGVRHRHMAAWTLGDKTIYQFRTYEVPPSTTEVTFLHSQTDTLDKGARMPCSVEGEAGFVFDPASQTIVDVKAKQPSPQISDTGKHLCRSASGPVWLPPGLVIVVLSTAVAEAHRWRRANDIAIYEATGIEPPRTKVHHLGTTGGFYGYSHFLCVELSTWRHEIQLEGKEETYMKLRQRCEILGTTYEEIVTKVNT